MVETVMSVAMLGGFLWTVRFLVPKAAGEGDRFALACAVLTAVIALLLWLLTGVGTQSGAF